MRGFLNKHSKYVIFSHGGGTTTYEFSDSQVVPSNYSPKLFNISEKIPHDGRYGDVQILAGQRAESRLLDILHVEPRMRIFLDHQNLDYRNRNAHFGLVFRTLEVLSLIRPKGNY